MNLIVLQYTEQGSWRLSYNGEFVRTFKFEDNDVGDDLPPICLAMDWISTNPVGWPRNTPTQIIGPLSDVVGRLE